jgi:hypothetical protein
MPNFAYFIPYNDISKWLKLLVDIENLIKLNITSILFYE